MDRFDEISPTHADKATVIISELMETKVESVWVTSRPVQKERLKKELSVIVFSVKKLSNESQMKVFKNIWYSRAKGNKEKCLNDYVRRLHKLANKSITRQTSLAIHYILCCLPVFLKKKIRNVFRNRKYQSARQTQRTGTVWHVY
jgi:hypothetical protein